MKVVAVIQARMGSTRFPGKVLEKIGHYHALAWTLHACRAAREINETWIATTTEEKDDVLESFAKRHSCPVHRGSETDVLRRIYETAVKANADIVVRITGDLPFLDADVVDAVVRLLLQNPALVYATNVDPPTWPDGLDVQAVRFAALEAANKEATRPSDRDTVTQWIYRNRERFPAANLTCPVPDLQEERWVLDTKEDLEFLSLVAQHLTGRPSYTSILEILSRYPHFRKVNNRWRRNERFFAEVARDMGDAPRKFTKSTALLADARKVQPYGASTYSKSAVAFGDDYPLYVTHAMGSKVFDVDGNDYVDLTGGLCTAIVGYNDPDINKAIRSQLDCGISFPVGTSVEYNLARRLADITFADAMVAFGKNGSDVTSAAVRIARAATDRGTILIREEGYHGWQDWALDGTERDHATDDCDVERLAKDTKIPVLEKKLATKKYAAFIIEPEGSEASLREIARLCKKYDTLLIVDEVVTFLRYPDLYAFKQASIEPDLVCIGKSLGNGMPISALIGKAEYMRKMAPSEKEDEQNCFYSGTFFGETLSMAAAGATLSRMEVQSARNLLADRHKKLHSIVSNVIRHSSMDKIVEIGPEPLNRLTFKKKETARKFRYEMAQNGVLIYSMNNASLALSDDDLLRVEIAYNRVLPELKPKDNDNEAEEESRWQWIGNIMRR